MNRVRDPHGVLGVTPDADPAAGSGLRGLVDRVAALDGRLRVDSPPGGGTRVVAEIPLPSAAPTPAEPVRSS